MKLLEEYSKKKYRRILGVDASSTGIGVALIEGGEIAHLAKLNIPNGDMIKRLGVIRLWFPGLLKAYLPEFVMIEEPVMVKSVQSAKVVSYVAGILYAECVIKRVPVTDVQPMSWKAYLGVKMMTKTRKEEIVKKMGEKLGNKEINRLRKSQTMDIMSGKYPGFNWYADDDIADAAGIALYAWSKWGTNA